MDEAQNDTAPAAAQPAVEVLKLGTTGRKLDAAAVEQGLRQECPFRPGFFVSILPAASYNPRYKKAMQSARVSEKAVREQDPEKRDEEIGKSYLSRYEDPEFVAEAFVANMEGIFRGDGSPVPYTQELGAQILRDGGNADVMQWIVSEAHQYGKFYTDQVARDSGN